MKILLKSRSTKMKELVLKLSHKAKTSMYDTMDYFFSRNIFNWKIITLECCVGFCHTIA